MSPQCNDKGKKNYLIEKIHSQRFDTHEISQILIKSTTNIFDFPTNTVYLYTHFDIRMTEEDKNCYILSKANSDNCCFFMKS